MYLIYCSIACGADEAEGRQPERRYAGKPQQGCNGFHNRNIEDAIEHIKGNTFLHAVSGCDTVSEVLLSRYSEVSANTFPSTITSNHSTSQRKREMEFNGLKDGRSPQKLIATEVKDQRTLEAVTKKLRNKKKLSVDFKHYELQMIWEATVKDLRRHLNLSSDDDFEFLQSLCCDLFLYHDDYKSALAMEELLLREEEWESKLEGASKLR